MVRVGDENVYPIFRVGSTSLFDSCTERHTNQQIKELDNITVLLRDPEERFVSGLNKYCWQHDLDVHQTWELVKGGSLVDRHFAPQYLWLMHLSVFHKGKVKIKPFSYINALTDQHFISAGDRGRVKTQVPVIEKFVEVDKQLLGYMDQEVSLQHIIKEHRNALS